MHNQTKEEFKIIGVDGVAFLLFDNDGNDENYKGRPYMKKKVENVTYEDTIKSAETAHSFSFFPYGINIIHNGEEVTVTNETFKSKDN